MTLSSLFSHFQFLFSEIVAITALANSWLSITLSVTVSLNLNLNCYWKANSWIQSNQSCKWHALTLGTCFTNWKMIIIWSFFRAKEIVNLPVRSRGFPRSLFSIIQWFFVWKLVAKLSQVRVCYPKMTLTSAHAVNSCAVRDIFSTGAAVS